MVTPLPDVYRSYARAGAWDRPGERLYRPQHEFGHLAHAHLPFVLDGRAWDALHEEASPWR